MKNSLSLAGVDTADLLLWNPDLADDLARQRQYLLFDLQVESNQADLALLLYYSQA